MRLGIFGDIHGNIDALAAAYDAAMAAGAEKLFHLGDLGGYAPFINETVEFLRRHGIEGVQGNYDEAVANDREHCGCRYEDPLQAEMANLAFAWTKRRATEATKQYLRALPQSIRFAVDGITVHLFHATPTKNNLYWHEDRPDKFYRDMASRTDARVLIFGHTHIPFRRDLDGRVFINAGSVGRPKDGDPRTCVAVVDISAAAVAVEFLRVSYAVADVAKAIIREGLPSYFAQKLQEGR